MLGFEDVGEFEKAYLRPQLLMSEGIALAPHAARWTSATVPDAAGYARQRHDLRSESVCIPVADNARFEDCIRWGDDYQLLFTASPETALPIAATRIGSVLDKGSKPLLLDGSPPDPNRPLGYQH